MLAGAVLVLCSTAAQAQINPFRGYKGPTLSSQDYTLAREAARKLLNNDSAAVGSSEQWQNADTGHGGTITLMSLFQRSGMPCRTLQSRVEYKAPDKPRTVTLKACRTQAGEWKLL
jgi:surface antigen